MTPEQKLDLIRDLVQTVAFNTELLDKDSFGDDMAEVVLAITYNSDYKYELYGDNERQQNFYEFLQEKFDAESPLWDFVEFVP